MGWGSGSNGEWTFLDIVALISFVVGLQNLDLNVTQNDLESQTRELDNKVDMRVNQALSEIHSHLETQDMKIDEILQRLEVKA